MRGKIARHAVGAAALVVLASASFAAEGEVGTTVGKIAVDFTLETTRGTVVKLSALRGRKGVVLDFWATWCPPCIRGVPHMIEFNKRYADRGLVVLGINVRESKSKAESFMKQVGINYPVLLDEDASVTRRYGVRGIPTYIGIDKKGMIIYRAHGMPRDLEGFARALTQ